MYINPFVAGVISTIMVELLACIITPHGAVERSKEEPI